MPEKHSGTTLRHNVTLMRRLSVKRRQANNGPYWCNNLFLRHSYNSGCGRVMFSQACVKNSFHGGVYTPPWQIPSLLGRHTTPGRQPLGRHPLGQTSALGRHPQGRPHHPGRPPGAYTLPPPPKKTATTVDGMHPTGMHSC